MPGSQKFSQMYEGKSYIKNNSLDGNLCQFESVLRHIKRLKACWFIPSLSILRNRYVFGSVYWRVGKSLRVTRDVEKNVIREFMIKTVVKGSSKHVKMKISVKIFNFFRRTLNDRTPIIVQCSSVEAQECSFLSTETGQMATLLNKLDL